jgi:hypothetical protein
MFIHEFSERKNIFYVLYKKDKFMYEHMTIYRTYFYLFYRCHIKCYFLSKTCVGTLNDLIYMQNLFLNFFDILKFVFYVFSIIGSYRPGSQNTSSIKQVHNRHIYTRESIRGATCVGLAFE